MRLPSGGILIFGLVVCVNLAFLSFFPQEKTEPASPKWTKDFYFKTGAPSLVPKHSSMESIRESYGADIEEPTYSAMTGRQNPGAHFSKDFSRIPLKRHDSWLSDYVQNTDGQLKSFELKSFVFSEYSIEIFADLFRKNGSISYLRLEHTNFNAIFCAFLARKDNIFSSLRSIKLINNELSPFQLQQFLDLCPTTLRQFEFSELRNFSSSKLQAQLNFDRFSGLKSLILSGVGNSAVDYEFLFQSITKWDSLRRLDLSNNGLKQIPNSLECKNFNKMRILNLANNCISSSSLCSFLSNKQFKRLKELNIENNKISDLTFLNSVFKEEKRFSKRCLRRLYLGQSVIHSNIANSETTFDFLSEGFSFYELSLGFFNFKITSSLFKCITEQPYLRSLELIGIPEESNNDLPKFRPASQELRILCINGNFLSPTLLSNVHLLQHLSIQGINSTVELYEFLIYLKDLEERKLESLEISLNSEITCTEEEHIAEYLAELIGLRTLKLNFPISNPIKFMQTLKGSCSKTISVLHLNSIIIDCTNFDLFLNYLSCFTSLESLHLTLFPKSNPNVAVRQSIFKEKSLIIFPHLTELSVRIFKSNHPPIKALFSVCLERMPNLVYLNVDLGGSAINYNQLFDVKKRGESLREISLYAEQDTTSLYYEIIQNLINYPNLIKINCKSIDCNNLLPVSGFNYFITILAHFCEEYKVSIDTSGIALSRSSFLFEILSQPKEQELLVGRTEQFVENIFPFSTSKSNLKFLLSIISRSSSSEYLNLIEIFEYSNGESFNWNNFTNVILFCQIFNLDSGVFGTEQALKHLIGIVRILRNYQEGLFELEDEQKFSHKLEDRKKRTTIELSYLFTQKTDKLLTEKTAVLALFSNFKQSIDPSLCDILLQEIIFTNIDSNTDSNTNLIINSITPRRFIRLIRRFNWIFCSEYSPLSDFQFLSSLDMQKKIELYSIFFGNRTIELIDYLINESTVNSPIQGMIECLIRNPFNLELFRQEMGKSNKIRDVIADKIRIKPSETRLNGRLFRRFRYYIDPTRFLSKYRECSALLTVIPPSLLYKASERNEKKEYEIDSDEYPIFEDATYIDESQSSISNTI